jgi:hypothetical protein
MDREYKMSNGYGLRKGIEYLETTYEINNVEVVASTADNWEINLYLPDAPNQEFTQEDIATMAMYSCYHSTDDGYSHFIFVA